MKAHYEIQFQSKEQREAFEALLKRMGVDFCEIDSGLAEEPQADYQAVDPALLEMTDEDWENIRLGDEDIKAGRVVPWETVKAELTALVDELTGREKNG